MKKVLVSLILVGSVFSIGGCTHLASVSTTEVPKQRGKSVKAEADKFIFFAFNFNNDYVNEMTMSLAKKCPGGKVSGILTKHETITYFPLIAHKVRVSAEGYCVN